MSGLASVLLAKGARVSGSDLAENREVRGLRRAGAEVHVGHDPRLVTGDLDGVIVSSAIDGENAEVAAARTQGIPIVRRLDAMARLLRGHRSIGVAGTHGKTTTSAMVATILRGASRSPSFLIGAHCPGLGGNAHLGSGEWFVAEIDESDGLLVSVDADVAVLTNMGCDHLQTYRDFPAIQRAFRQYVGRAKQAVLSIDDPNVARLAEMLDNPLTVGIEPGAKLRATNLTHERFHTAFDLLARGRRITRVNLPAPGRHNVRNALCALGAAMLAGIDLGDAARALEGFTLPHRRFELLEENGVTVVDDYAHLPEEIEATLNAIRSGWPDRRIVAVFQPHRFSRTQRLGREFGKAFTLAHSVIVTSIYPACEPPLPGVTSRTIVDAVGRETSAEVHSISDKARAIDHLKRTIVPGDFIISFGAGDIWTVTEELACFLEAGNFVTA